LYYDGRTLLDPHPVSAAFLRPVERARVKEMKDEIRRLWTENEIRGFFAARTPQ